MKRLLIVLLLLAMSMAAVEPASARRVFVRRPVRERLVHRRTVVVVGRGWPLRRPLRTVWVRPGRVPIGVPAAAFLAPVVWTSMVIAAPPPPSLLVWEDAETLSKPEGWTEFTLECNERGRKLDLEVAGGRVQFDWAEVVFANGDSRVVDFSEKTVGPGLYSLLDFRDGRKVDHVRVVAQAKSPEARVALKMEK